MGSIRYRSCSVTGTRADAILTFREAMAEAVVAVQDEIAKLDNLTTTRRDEEVVLVEQEPSTLLKYPLNDSLVVRSASESQGAIYRKQPTVETQKLITTVDGTEVPQGRGGLRDTVEAAAAQWLFQKVDGTEASATDDLTDSSFYGRDALLPTGLSASSVDDGGPLGYSRTFDANTYFRVKTGVAITNVSQSLLLNYGDLCAWGWVNPDSASERVVLSFSSPPLDAAASISGTATVSNGSPSVVVTSSTGLSKYCRVVFSSQPEKVYEVSDISGLTLTLSESYTGSPSSSATMLLAFSKADGIIQPPEARNTLYALSVQQNAGKAKVRFYWQRKNKMNYEVVNSNVDWDPGEYLFVGFQRRQRVLQGKVTRSGTSVYGTGTNFTDEFGTGAVSGKWIRFTLDGVDPDAETAYQVVYVDNDGLLTIDAPVTLRDVTDACTITSQRIMIHVGKLDGTFDTEIVDHLPPPTGGIEPEDPVTRVALGNFYIGRDFENPSTNFTGTMNAVSLYTQPIDTSDSIGTEDERIRFMFSRSFADYVASGQTIQRTVLSDIEDGQTVYCDYTYATGITEAQSTTSTITGHVDGMLSGLENPNVKDTSQLAQTIGTPDPAKQGDVDELSRMMGKFGIMTANGQPLIKGGDDITAYRALVQTVGGIEAANALLAGKPDRSFILVALVEDVSEVLGVDTCGVPTTTLVVTERVVGINKNLFEAARVGGYQDTGPLKLKLWWVGSVGRTDASIQKMKNYGMTGSQMADALSLVSSDKMTVYVIANPNAGLEIISTGILGDDLDAILTRPNDENDIDAIELNPNIKVMAAALQTAMNAPSGTTVDGDPNPLDPALIAGRVIDFGKALFSKAEDLFPPEVLDAADADCQALVAIVDDVLQNTTRVLGQVNQAVVPYALHQKASVGNQKLAFSKYIPCVANVSANFALPEFHLKINLVSSLFRHLLEQTAAVTRQAIAVVQRFNTLLCIPRVLIAALRGGVCGIEQPKAVANRQCPPQLDMILDRLKALIDTIDLLLRKILVALTTIDADIEVSGGAASGLAVDATLPCIGPVANFLLVLR